jgi:hypothetical protein
VIKRVWSAQVHIGNLQKNLIVDQPNSTPTPSPNSRSGTSKLMTQALKGSPYKLGASWAQAAMCNKTSSANEGREGNSHLASQAQIE